MAERLLGRSADYPFVTSKTGSAAPHLLNGAIEMSQKKILLVDDDPEVRLALGLRLKHNNYDIVAAVDGVTALAEAASQMPDLILLDLGLPGGDGFTVIERLQQNGALAHIPIIVVSGRDRLASRDRALKAGARLFLQKPVKNTDLLIAIAQVLSPKPAPTPPAYDIAITPLASL